MTTSEVNNDLDIANCVVTLEVGRNLPYIDRNYIEEKLTRETVESLRASGVSVVNGYSPAQLGGTSVDIVALVQSLLHFKQVLMLIITLVKALYIVFRRYIEKKYDNRRPSMNVSLMIRSDKFADEKNFSDDIAFRINMLCHVAQAEATRLASKYPIYKFGITVKIDMPKNGFSTTYGITNADNIFAYKRLCAASVGAKVEEGLDLRVSILNNGFTEYEATRLTLILDSPHGEPDWRYIKGPVKYYMLISNGIIGGFAQKRHTMSYADYKRKHLTGY